MPVRNSAVAFGHEILDGELGASIARAATAQMLLFEAAKKVGFDIKDKNGNIKTFVEDKPELKKLFQDSDEAMADVDRRYETYKYYDQIWRGLSKD